MAGRSNLQQAVPLTFGFKTGHCLRMRDTVSARATATRVLVGEFGGAVGTLASSAAMAQAASGADAGIGLGQPDIAGTPCATASAKSLAFSASHRHAWKGFHGREAAHADEVAEVYEPFHEGRVIEYMPEKRNPISCFISRDHRAGTPAGRCLLEAAVAITSVSTGPGR